MKITLIDWTGKGTDDPWTAADLLIFTKNTRVKMSPDGMKEIAAWPVEKKMAELDYMANTIRASHEFVEYTYMMEDVTRAFTHQLVRHRTGSYAQQTQQILNVKGFTTERPDFLHKYGNVDNGLSKPGERDGDFTYHSNKSADMQAAWDSTVRTIAQAYDHLQELGATVEEARGLLPTNVHTNIVAKFSLRTLVDIIHARVSPRNLGEFREVTVQMRDEVLRVHPWAHVFVDHTKDRVLADMDDELIDLRRREPEKATKMLKLVDQLRRGS
jgi:flavin-dependent thymidylate synthase